MGSEDVCVGREAFVQNVHVFLQRDRQVVITGASGIGKTVAVQAYVRRFASAYQRVCWIDAATEETFLADLLQAVPAWSWPARGPTALAGLLQAFQASLAAQQRVLLVLDHFSFPFRLPDASVAQSPLTLDLIIITCGQRTPARLPHLELAGLLERDGALLVLRRSGLLAASGTLEQGAEEPRVAAQELARELRGAPLALALAGDYLRETGESLQDYLYAFREYPARVSSVEDNEWAQAVAVACDLSLAYLERTQPAALESLQTCALLAPGAIPAALCQQESRTALASGLLAADHQGSLWRMHPCVQDIVRQLSALDQQRQRAVQAWRMFHQLLPAFQAQALPARLRVAGHIRRLAGVVEEGVDLAAEAAEVLCWAASLLWEQRLPGLAEPLLRKALASWERTLGYTHPTVATVLANLAVLNGQLNNYVEAEMLAHRAIQSKAGALGAGHPDVLLALDTLGHCYAARGKQREAQHCYEKAISIGDRVQLQQHPAYSMAMYDLALLYIGQEQDDAAEPLLRRVCAARDAVPGPQDATTMAAWFSLAEVSVRLHNWKRAEASYWHALPVCESLLGAEHPVMLSHLLGAAHVFLRRGKLTDAQEHFQRVLGIDERTAQLDVRQRVRCLNGLAQVVLARGHLSEAQTLLQRAQDLCATRPQPEDVLLAEVLDTLVEVEMAQQQDEQALVACRQAYDLRVRLLGDRHLLLVENLVRLATLYLQQGRPQQAEPLLLQALFLYQQAHKPEDLDLDPALTGLAEIERARGHSELARMYLERSRALREQALGQAHPRTIEVVRMLEELASAHHPGAEKK